MYVRVSNFDSVTLHFSCSRESMKIQVGAVAGVETPTNMSADNLVLAIFLNTIRS